MNSVNLISSDAHSEVLTGTQKLLADLWREVLQTTCAIQLEDNFFELGGDSMAMVTLEFRIQEVLPVIVPPGTVLGAATLRQLAETVDSLSAQAAEHA